MGRIFAGNCDCWKEGYDQGYEEGHDDGREELYSFADLHRLATFIEKQLSSSCWERSLIDMFHSIGFKLERRNKTLCPSCKSYASGSGTPEPNFSKVIYSGGNESKSYSRKNQESSPESPQENERTENGQYASKEKNENGSSQ